MPLAISSRVKMAEEKRRVKDLLAQRDRAEGFLADRTAELAGALLANATLTQRLEKAESWSSAYKQMLRDVLDLMPAGYMSPEHQTKLMRAWNMATDGAHQFKPRGSK